MVTRLKKKTVAYVVSFVLKSNEIERQIYKVSCMEIIRAVQNLGCIEFSPTEEAKYPRIYFSLSAFNAKISGTKRLSLYAATSNDHDHGLFTATATINKIPVWFVLAISVSLKLTLYAADVTKVFIASNTPLHRPIYMQPLTEMNLQKRN